MSPRRRVTQGNLSRKNPLPSDGRGQAGQRAAPTPGRAPTPRGSPRPPGPRLPWLARRWSPALLGSLRLWAPAGCWADCRSSCHPRTPLRLGSAGGQERGDSETLGDVGGVASFCTGADRTVTRQADNRQNVLPSWTP